jgi:hypothetical protein
MTNTAKPEPVGPTDEELREIYREYGYIHDEAEDPHDWWGSMNQVEFIEAARYVLARWGGSVSTNTDTVLLQQASQKL